jgi:hypothetical protein
LSAESLILSWSFIHSFILECLEDQALNMSKKRTIDSFFGIDPSKKQRVSSLLDEVNTTPPAGRLMSHILPIVTGPQTSASSPHSNHLTYPFPIPELPLALSHELVSLPARPGRTINDQPDLDLVYFEPYIPTYLAKELFQFLRSQLPFYRVEYKIKRGGIETLIRTPRSCFPNESLKSDPVRNYLGPRAHR